MITDCMSKKEKHILSKAWTVLTPDDLRYLYFDLNYSRTKLSEVFDATIKQVEYKLRKYGLNKQKQWAKDALSKALRKAGEETLGSIVFEQFDSSFGPDDIGVYGPVKVTKGKHKGRIGMYDDDFGGYGYVLWGDSIDAINTECRIPLSYLTNNITTYDLVKRTIDLYNQIGNAQMGKAYGEKVTLSDDQIINLYSEYIMVMKMLNEINAKANYLQGEGDKTVFISHASQDKEISSMIATDLKRARYNVWFDKWDIELGHSVPQAITDGLDSADALVIVLSKDYLRSAFCTDEWQCYYMKFNSQRKPILTIIIDDSRPPTILASRKYHRMKSIDGYDDMLIDLKLALSKM